MDEELVPEDEGLSVSSSGLLELKRLEFEEREKERASQLRLKEMELREKELNIQLRLKELEKNTEPTSPTKRPTATFDVSKHIRFVPPFQEKEVDKYFLHFEKIATVLSGPAMYGCYCSRVFLLGKLAKFILRCQLNTAQNMIWLRRPSLRRTNWYPKRIDRILEIIRRWTSKPTLSSLVKRKPY